MGLFSRKSPEEKRLENFNKIEQNVIKLKKSYLCSIRALFDLSANEEEYVKTADYFKEWALVYVGDNISKIKFWPNIDFWNNFVDSYTKGLASLMVVGDYAGYLECCESILDLREVLYSKKIARSKAGGVVGFAGIVGAAVGAGGHAEQDRFLEIIKLFKAVGLAESGKEPLARLLVKNLPENFAFVIKKDDDYFNQHFKYKDNISVAYLKSVLFE